MTDDLRRLNLVAMGLQVMNQISDSSSSSSKSSGDEELEGLELVNRIHRRKVPRLENYVEQVLPALSDQEFLYFEVRLMQSSFFQLFSYNSQYIMTDNFRMCRETFHYVLSIIGPRLRRRIPGTTMISPEKQFLVAIWRLATPDSLSSICERFNVGRSTAVYVTRRLIGALNELSSVFIRWPRGERIQQISAGFEAVSAFPKVIGAVDGTHINIPAPSANPESYVNRKGCHSVILQAVCDHSGCFLHCYAGHVGSVHDYLGDDDKFYDDCHILGDSAYKLYENLLVPFRDNGHLTERQRNYNFCHASARIAIERAFGLLKGRFRSLLTVLPMRKVENIPAHIMACCVLHNICLLRGDDLIVAVNEGDADNMPQNVQHDGAPAAAGAAKRDLICQRLLMRVV